MRLDLSAFSHFSNEQYSIADLPGSLAVMKTCHLPPWKTTVGSFWARLGLVARFSGAISGAEYSHEAGTLKAAPLAAGMLQAMAVHRIAQLIRHCIAFSFRIRTTEAIILPEV